MMANPVEGKAGGPLSEPFAHSVDTDVFHFPGERHWDVYDWSHQYLGDTLSFVGISGLSKFMFLELIAAVVCLLILSIYAWNIRRNGYPRGTFANAIESIMLFIRDNAVIPSIGEHDAHKFLPFLWSVFFFILVNNLLGMFPYLGSATGALGCTLALAVCTFLTIHGSGMAQMGVFGYAEAFVPHVPIALYPLMLIIEIVGHTIKPTILAVRLFVNMLAGHTVLFVILAFIKMAPQGFLYFPITLGSLVGVIALSLLELFVAFLQAFVFTYLSAIFIGSAVHPHH